MSDPTGKAAGFDTAAAVTRSLLGWGVVVGIFYLVVGVTQGLLREGFDFSRHALSLLMLGAGGWVQSLNLILSGLMVLAAALGFARATQPAGAAKWVAGLLGTYGLALIGGGIFAPDPMPGFPPGTTEAGASLSGILHLAFGGVGFLALASAAFVVAGWLARRGAVGFARLSRLSGAVILIGFLSGAALSANVIGVVLLWVAVVAGWAWLAAASVYAYRTVPHPDAWRRGAASAPER